MRSLILSSMLLLAACVSPQEAAYRSDRDAAIKRFNERIAKIDDAHSYGATGCCWTLWIPPTSY